GSLYLDLRFERLPLLRKLSTFPAARIGGTLLVALVVALLAALVNLVAGRRPRVRADAEEDFVADAERRPPLTPTPLPPGERGWGEGAAWWRSLMQDAVRGVGAVFTVGLAVAVYLLGERGQLETGWAALGVAAAGAALAEWWKFGLTGKHLTPREAFQN